MSDIRFTSSWAGLRRLKRLIGGTVAGIGVAFGKNRIENYLLERTRDRFKPAGSAPTAQRDPSGKAWPRLAPSTVRRRKRNRNRSQALFDEGKLAASIQVVSSNSSPTAFQSALGGGFSIGVNKASPAYLYYALHNSGGRNVFGVLVPRRQFLGIGRDDVTAIGSQVKQDILNSIRGV